MALMMALKGDFHMHTREDPQDHRFVTHSAEELIDHAAKEGFEVLSITAHNKIHYSPYLRDYAAQRGILLIPGVEVSIEGKHVLLINYLGTVEFKSLADLKKVKSPEVLIMAAHPFFPGFTTLKERLTAHIDLFDAIEYCHFYHRWFNFNRRAVALSKAHNKPLVGTSDAHFLMQMGHTYTVVNVNRKTAKAVVEAIKAGNIQVVSKPLSLRTILTLLSKFRLSLLTIFSK